jgi:hypothetical protein
VGFFVDRVTQGKGFLEVLRFFLVSNIPSLLLTRVSSGGWTKGPVLAQFDRESDRIASVPVCHVWSRTLRPLYHSLSGMCYGGCRVSGGLFKRLFLFRSTDVPVCWHTPSQQIGVQQVVRARAGKRKQAGAFRWQSSI